MHRTSRLVAGILATAVLILMPVSPLAQAAPPAPVPNCLHAAAADQVVVPPAAGTRPALRPVGKFICPKLDK